MFKRLLAGVISLAAAIGCFAGPAAVGAAEPAAVAVMEDADNQLPFTDVVEEDWFCDAVSYNYFRGLMTGMDVTHFGPYENLSRAQFAVILHRMNDEPEMDYTDRFVDVQENTWYTDAILWAADAGIVSGYGNTGIFGPADRITREQMAIMIQNYSNYQGYNTSAEADLERFLDASSVSDFANEAMAWAVGDGIITGKSEGTMLDPQGNATRAECAAIIMRFMEKYKEPETITYTGYDGYIWNGAVRTTQKDTEWDLDENVFESTLGIEGTMSRYFEGQYLDLSENRIALMANYMPYTELTQYGGLTITEITVYAEKEGMLSIGTAKVSDVVRARTEALAYTANTTQYDVEQGLNTITLQMEVAEDETIVLGGNDSVGLYYVSGIPVEDEQGIFTMLDGKTHKDVLNQTNEVKDKLDIQVKVELTGREERVFETFEEDFSGFSAASAPAVVSSMAPYAYKNQELFENKVVTKIGIPVKSVSAINANQVFTVSVIDNQTLSTTAKEYKLVIPVEELGTSTTVGKFIYVNCEIPVGENQTLAFGTKSGDISWGYYSAKNDARYAFYSKAGTSGVSVDTRGNALVFDVYAVGDISYESHLEELKEKEDRIAGQRKLEKLIETTRGKNFSILADSISTYQGYSNDAANTNSTIGKNAVWYSSSLLKSVEDTWWMQAVRQTEMNLLVNNSWSGSRVLYSNESAGYRTRPLNLHDNTGANAGTKPDIVAVFMGINDFDFDVPLGTYSEELYDTLITEDGNGTVSYKEPANFTEAYIIMIDKIIREYEGVDVFCFTLLPNNVNTDYAGLERFNDTIRAIADYYGAGVVDLYNDSGITVSNFQAYTTDGLHPNATGMDMLTETFVNTLIEKYVE